MSIIINLENEEDIYSCVEGHSYYNQVFNKVTFQLNYERTRRVGLRACLKIM